MSRNRVARLLALALLTPCFAAWGAGFDCTHAKGVAQRICSDDQLSQLDDQLTLSFERARSRAGQGQLDALSRDQRNWLVERDWAIANSDGLGAQAYKDRIAFLDRLYREPETASPLLAAISAYMSSSPSIARGTGQVMVWWPYLGGNGKVFSMGEKLKPDDAKSFPFDPKDVLKQSTTFANAVTTDPAFVLFDAAHLGGAYAEQGSAGEENDIWQLFGWRDHTVKDIDPPDVFKPMIAPNGGALALYKGNVYALRIDDTGLATSDITAQPYLGDHWGDPVRLQLRYDTYLLPADSYCAESDCAELSAQAGRIIGRYNQLHDNDALIGDLSAEQRAAFGVLRPEAEKQAAGNLSVLPNFDGKPKYLDDASFLGFGESTFFPIQWHGELLIARIGNGCWDRARTNCNEDLLLAIWRWDGKTFTPVLGMVRQKRRGDFLLEEWLPADLHIPD
jgi:uncharacterized protein